jgi:hypothetical protein
MTTEKRINYIPGSIDFRTGKGVDMEVDSAKGVELVKQALSEGRRVERAELGLDGDWRENSTVIYDEAGFHEYDAYHGSLWATPTLILFFKDGPSEAFDCWKMAAT